MKCRGVNTTIKVKKNKFYTSSITGDKTFTSYCKNRSYIICKKKNIYIDSLLKNVHISYCTPL